MGRFDKLLKTLESRGISPGTIMRKPKVVETEDALAAKKAVDWSKYFDETKRNPSNPNPELREVPFLNENAPLEPLAPHFNPARQTPEDIEKLYLNEIQKRHSTNSQLQKMHPETQSLENTQMINPSALTKMAGVGAIPTAQSINPFDQMQQGIDFYKQNIEEPVANASENVARKIVGGTTPLAGEQKEQFVNEMAPMVGMGINPTNYVPYLPEASLGADAFSKLRGYLRGK